MLLTSVPLMWLEEKQAVMFLHCGISNLYLSPKLTVIYHLNQVLSRLD
jgi:hydroxylamine reductase (hybrid-cluster protein)